MKHFKELGIQKSVLNDNQQQLQHVAGGSLKVVGSCYLSFNLHGYTCTEQVYFVAGTTKTFLSINTCKGLKLIHHNFPYHTVAGAMDVACLTNQSEPSNTVKEDGQSTPSELPCRQEVMPYDATDPCNPFKWNWHVKRMMTDDNIGKLEEWFLQTFADTVFNINQHPLPVMSGKPQHLHLQEGSTPHTIHTPIMIPHHWHKGVMQRLQEDVVNQII